MTSSKFEYSTYLYVTAYGYYITKSMTVISLAKKYWIEVRNWSGKSDKAEESNTLRCSKPANMAKSDWEPITSVTLKNCYRY